MRASFDGGVSRNISLAPAIAFVVTRRKERRPRSGHRKKATRNASLSSQSTDTDPPLLCDSSLRALHSLCVALKRPNHRTSLRSSASSICLLRLVPHHTFFCLSSSSYRCGRPAHTTGRVFFLSFFYLSRSLKHTRAPLRPI